MDLSLCANPEAASSRKPNGASCDTPLRSWPLSRRSGRFPALPYPPLRPIRILIENENVERTRYIMATMPQTEDDVQRSYDGYLVFHGVSQETVDRLIVLGRESGIELDVSATAMEFRFVGRDTNRFVVRILQRIADIIKEADGEIQCEVSKDTELSLEFYRIRGGRLFRQLADIVRQPEEEVS
jgi:hypothetical protein